MDKEQQELDIERSKKIEKQVQQWDLYAKIVPTAFLLMSFLFISFGIINFDALFYIGMILFSFTAVTWWFWTIFSIRFLIRLLRKSSINLLDVALDLKEAKTDLKEYLNEQDNSRKRN